MYDGKKIYSFFTESPEPFFNAILKRKYRGYTIYAHNLSKFDIIFVFNYLAKLSFTDRFKIKPIIKDGRIISIDIRNEHGISLKFRDSYLMLTESLLKLSKTFKCEIKMMEPVLISCSDPNNQKYVQNNINHYTKEVLKIVDFLEWKKMIILYCENDSVILHQILLKFRELVFKNWGINIENYPTISSLAFAIFRKKYLKENMIPITSGKVFDFIKESFTGGATDVYKFYGENIKVYDANALYPTKMKSNKFPIGAINLFEGDITILDQENTYWIADSSVKTKNDLYYPYLQIHQKINGQKRTISPNGSWNMKIHCCEYHNSLEHYDISIRNGYYFEKGDLFSEFVDDLYKLRLSYPKGDPMNLTCKLIMNSLFGRFAMKPIITTQSFMSKKDFIKLTENTKYEIDDFLDLEANGLFVSYSDMLSKKDHKISIGIASAITAMGRVEMANMFKKKTNIHFFYIILTLIQDLLMVTYQKNLLVMN
uniref:hypothetical protein n=1 Tax=Lentinus flexipes TaxID=3163629 RepID=UPI002264C4A2|nr:hypothetical protein OSR58_mgp17 [Ganoderma flexipes]UYX56944.1 hypothetical protein [Ganoderma flexipes]